LRVWQEKKLYGKTYMGIVRSTFIIDKKGVIRKIFPKVKVKGHGDDVMAVASGRLVTAVYKYEDQIPGLLPPGLPIEEADGNYVVLDLGGGNFGFYAHMIKGSITVKEGDFVTRGQVIGHLGNSGNTSAPHLHFHVIAGPSSLGSNGLPYVADGYELLARSASTEAFDNAEINGVPLEMVPVPNPGPHTNDLYLDQSIVNFPE
jgi:murein DD-endopeptidase MepM/ murein hydrolase activator NlpD